MKLCAVGKEVKVLNDDRSEMHRGIQNQTAPSDELMSPIDLSLIGKQQMVYINDASTASNNRWIVQVDEILSANQRV